MLKSTDQRNLSYHNGMLVARERFLCILCIIFCLILKYECNRLGNGEEKERKLNLVSDTLPQEGTIANVRRSQMKKSLKIKTLNHITSNTSLSTSLIQLKNNSQIASILPSTNITQSSHKSNITKSSTPNTIHSSITPASVSSPSISKLVKPASKFYIYELPQEFWWRWPISNGSAMQAQCKANGYLGVEHTEYSALGRPIDPKTGLFLTWHFSMFNSLYNRLLHSSRRTFLPDQASLFVIPYDLGLDGYLNPLTCRNRRQCSNGLVGKLMEILQTTPYLSRYEGADHVLLWSLGQYHPWPHAGCDKLMQEGCKKCSISCYWMDPTKAENKFISMPFPSAYHWWDGIERVPWDVSRRKERNLTAVYLGSTQTLNPHHTKIRRAMAAQCNASSHASSSGSGSVDSRLGTASSTSSSFSSLAASNSAANKGSSAASKSAGSSSESSSAASGQCHWRKISHSSVDTNIGELLSVYTNAIFCLCPPGDDPARKAVFDAIVSGCIPVIFEVATLYNQYPWHIGEQAALDVSVYIPGGLIKANKIQLMDVLLAIPDEVIYRKQLALAQLAPRVQYATPPYDWLADYTIAGNPANHKLAKWDPPFKDAVEIALDGFFARSAALLSNASTTGIPHRLQSGRQWGTEYENVKVKWPKKDGSLEFGQEVNKQPSEGSIKQAWLQAQLELHQAGPGQPVSGKLGSSNSSSNSSTNELAYKKLSLFERAALSGASAVTAVKDSLVDGTSGTAIADNIAAKKGGGKRPHGRGGKGGNGGDKGQPGIVTGGRGHRGQGVAGAGGNLKMAPGEDGNQV